MTCAIITLPVLDPFVRYHSPFGLVDWVLVAAVEVVVDVVDDELTTDVVGGPLHFDFVPS